jgi:uncharacterized protein YecE (DUF72 family)
MITLPDKLRFGTSSWAYEGWQGLVYKKAYPMNRFSKDCLAEYAAFEYDGTRLFRTVGIDHTFYRPATEAQLFHYAVQLPDGFQVCSKVWEEITIPAYARHARYGDKAGSTNPRFLDASLCEELVVRPSLSALGNHAGPFIFEFQRSDLGPGEFLAGSDRFFSQLPAGPLYAVEIRHPGILSARYHNLLEAYGVSHVYNHWSSMPPLAAQHAALGRTFTANFVVVRLLTPLGMSHADAVKRASPYTKLVEPLPQMRTQTIALIRQAVAERRPTFVLANKRVEGYAPMTVQALVDLLRRSDIR